MVRDKKFKQAGFSGHLKCTQNKKYSQKQKNVPNQLWANKLLSYNNQIQIYRLGQKK